MSVIGKIVPTISSLNFGRIKINAALNNAKLRTYFTYTQELSQPLDRTPDFLEANQALEKCLKSGEYSINWLYLHNNLKAT